MSTRYPCPKYHNVFFNNGRPDCNVCGGSGSINSIPNGQKCFTCSRSHQWGNRGCKGCGGQCFIPNNLSKCPTYHSYYDTAGNPLCNTCNGAGSIKAVVSPPPAPTTYSGASSVQYDCFLSHDWSIDENGRNNHDRVRLVKNHLEQRGLRCWFDEERMTGNIIDRMTQGIESSKVFIVFVTRNYMNKVNGNESRDNCKLEFNYAFQRKGPSLMLPVVMETSMRNTREWTGGIGVLGTMLYYDFSQDSTLATMISTLFDRIKSL